MQIIQALASLAGLPSRQADDAALDQQMYLVALDGVTRYALSEAVKSIIRGGLGHTFFPSPVELRLACDRAQQPVRDMQRRITITEENRRDREEFDRVNAAKTPESKARVAAMMAKLDKHFEDGRREEEETQRAEVRARYGMTPETVASIPDQPVPSNFQRLPQPNITRKRTA
jgi:hypothetical protein